MKYFKYQKYQNFKNSFKNAIDKLEVFFCHKPYVSQNVLLG